MTNLMSFDKGPKWTLDIRDITKTVIKSLIIYFYENICEEKPSQFWFQYNYFEGEIISITKFYINLIYFLILLSN